MAIWATKKQILCFSLLEILKLFWRLFYDGGLLLQLSEPDQALNRCTSKQTSIPTPTPYFA